MKTPETFDRWVREGKNRRRKARPAGGLRPRRLRLESLEDRRLLAVFDVTTFADVIDPVDGVTSLREAVIAANANAGDDTITFAAPGTYALTILGTGEDAAATGDLNITDIAGKTTILGAGAATTIVDASALVWPDHDGAFSVRSGANAEFANVTITGASESGISNNGTLTVTDCTLSGNRGWWGGGILNMGDTVTITNSTLSGNSAEFGRGGGIFNVGTLTITNTIIAGSTGGDWYGAAGSGSHNLIQGGRGGPTDTISGDPRLGPLADNGGPTQTHALLDGSPALNAGDNALAVDALGNPLTTDQRGAGFVRPSGVHVDIGAFEVQAPADIDLAPASVDEDQPVETVVGTFSTMDPDLPSDTHTYTLVSGTGDGDNVSFTIDGDQLKTAAEFDFETKNSYSIRVRTTDAGGLWYEEACTVRVLDVDEIAPMVTVEQAAGQADPANSSPINFTVVFSEPVTGFDGADVVLGGTACPTTAVVTGGGTTYNVAVSGMSVSGSVTVSILAGAAQDAAGNLSEASTSEDNTVSYQAMTIAPKIIDNHDAGWDTLGFIKNTSAGYLGDYAYGGNSYASEFARWTFDVTPGTYRVSVTWPDRPYREATNAPFSIYNGTSTTGMLLATVLVNQRGLPEQDVNDGGFWFQDLESLGNGGIYAVTGSQLTVLLTDVGINGLITADAVRVEYLQPLHAETADSVRERTGAAALTETQLAPAVQQAVARWGTSDPNAAVRLSDVQVVISQLPDTVLGLASEATSTIWLDRDAAALGWSVVTDPWSPVTGHRPFDDAPMTNDKGPMTSDGVSLLNVVMHELGHLLGYEHSDDEHDLMAPVLSASPLGRSALDSSLSTLNSSGLSALDSNLSTLNSSRLSALDSSVVRGRWSVPSDSWSRADNLFADLAQREPTAADSSNDAVSRLLDSAEDVLLAAQIAKSGDEVVQARVPRRSRMERFERELDDWFAELAVDEAVE